MDYNKINYKNKTIKLVRKLMGCIKEEERKKRREEEEEEEGRKGRERERGREGEQRATKVRC
jgi:hypothetical protein